VEPKPAKLLDKRSAELILIFDADYAEFHWFVVIHCVFFLFGYLRGFLRRRRFDFQREGEEGGAGAGGGAGGAEGGRLEVHR